MIKIKINNSSSLLRGASEPEGSEVDRWLHHRGMRADIPSSCINLYGRTAQIGICSSHNQMINAIVTRHFTRIRARFLRPDVVGCRDSGLPRPSCYCSCWCCDIWRNCYESWSSTFLLSYSTRYQTCELSVQNKVSLLRLRVPCYKPEFASLPPNIFMALAPACIKINLSRMKWR